MAVKYVIIIQCDIAHRRCSGFACTKSFYNKEGAFEGCGEDVQYISFTCGGCCGKGVAAKLEHFSRHLKKHTTVTKEEIAIHLSSCMATDNYHYDRCPHIDYIKGIISKKGYSNVVEGSYISKGAEKKREEGKYHSYNA